MVEHEQQQQKQNEPTKNKKQQQQRKTTSFFDHGMVHFRVAVAECQPEPEHLINNKNNNRKHNSKNEIYCFSSEKYCDFLTSTKVNMYAHHIDRYPDSWKIVECQNRLGGYNVITFGIVKKYLKIICEMVKSWNYNIHIWNIQIVESAAKLKINIMLLLLLLLPSFFYFSITSSFAIVSTLFLTIRVNAI